MHFFRLEKDKKAEHGLLVVNQIVMNQFVTAYTARRLRLHGIGTLGCFDKLVSPHVRPFFVKALEVVRLAQQDVVRFGKVPNRDLTGTVLALGTGLVKLATIQGDLRVGRVDRLAARTALVGRAAAAVEFLHAFLNARHGAGK